VCQRSCFPSHSIEEDDLMSILLIEPSKALVTIGGEDVLMYEPLALEYVAAGTADEHDVQILDMRLEPDLEGVLGLFRPDVIGITAYTVNVKTVRRLFQAIKAWRPETLTEAGGHHATMVPEDFVSPAIDLIALGEGVFTFQEIVRRRDKGEGFDGIPGLFALGEQLTPDVMGGLLCRMRYIDDAPSGALEEGWGQVVIMGAGLDTRPYRVRGVETTQVVEIDHPAAQTLKKVCLRRALGGLPAHGLFIRVDLDRQCLDDAMRSSGFQPRERICFIWEGVTQYITAEAVDATLRTISRIMGVETTIVFTYIWRGIIDGSARSQAEERIVASAHRLGLPWIFGLEPVDIRPYLAERGLLLVEDLGADEYRERYLASAGRRMNVFEGERIVLARGVGKHAQA